MNTELMEKALQIASKSGDDLPVGAVLARNGEIIAITHNEKEKLNDPTAHAEILAIRQAAKKLNSWRLENCELYVTLEPCPMCTWAIHQARIKKVYFGSFDSLYGAFSVFPDLIKNTGISAKGGILEEKCDNILKEYFARLR